MKVIFFSIPDPKDGADNAVTRFCDNPAIRVKKTEPIPETRDGIYLKPACIMVSYESLADEEWQRRIAKYESLTLKRLAKIARSVRDQMGYRALKSDKTRVLHLQAFCGVSSEEAETIADLIKVPDIVDRLMEGEI
jgi:hypothetical protein